MKRYQKLAIAFLLPFLFFSCNQANKDFSESSTQDNMEPANYASSSAAIETGKDTSRKFIRTADLKFKVKDVIRSTYDIENITNSQDGFVVYTNLESNIDNQTTTAISADSLLETSYYSVTNSIRLRVPNTKLDTTLKEISRNIDYLDFRIIKADDVALQILSNELTENRNSKMEERLVKSIDKKGNKLSEVSTAEENILGKEAQSDNAKIETLYLKDQIAYSTVNISIYQRQAIKRVIIADEKNLETYKPGLGIKILDALKYGWEILASIIVFLFSLWGFIIVGLLIYLGYKVYKNKLKP